MWYYLFDWIEYSYLWCYMCGESITLSGLELITCTVSLALSTIGVKIPTDYVRLNAIM